MIKIRKLSVKTGCILAAILTLTIVAGTVLLVKGSSKPTIIPLTDEIDIAVTDAILSQNAKYDDGELTTEGHKVLEIQDYPDTLKVYLAANYSHMRFEDDKLTKCSGSSSIPTVITLAKGKDSSYTVISYQEPMEGDYYNKSFKKLFPSDLYMVDFHSADINNQLQEQEKAYAGKYLKSIGRTAEIQFNPNHYSAVDLNAPALKDIDKEYAAYPSWNGTLERIEDGVRYIYQKNIEDNGNGNGVITYTKKVYNGDIVKMTVLEIKDGEVTTVEL